MAAIVQSFMSCDSCASLSLCCGLAHGCTARPNPARVNLPGAKPEINGQSLPEPNQIQLRFMLAMRASVMCGTDASCDLGDRGDDM